MLHLNPASPSAVTVGAGSTRVPPGDPPTPGRIDFADLITRLTAAPAANAGAGLAGLINKTVPVAAAPTATPVIIDGDAAEGPADIQMAASKTGVAAKPVAKAAERSAHPGNTLAATTGVIELTGLMTTASIVQTPPAFPTAMAPAQSAADEQLIPDPQIAAAASGVATPLVTLAVTTTITTTVTTARLASPQTFDDATAALMPRSTEIGIASQAPHGGNRRAASPSAQKGLTAVKAPPLAVAATQARAVASVASPAQTGALTPVTVPDALSDVVSISVPDAVSMDGAASVIAGSPKPPNPSIPVPAPQQNGTAIPNGLQLPSSASSMPPPAQGAPQRAVTVPSGSRDLGADAGVAPTSAATPSAVVSPAPAGTIVTRVSAPSDAPAPLRSSPTTDLFGTPVAASMPTEASVIAVSQKPESPNASVASPPQDGHPPVSPGLTGASVKAASVPPINHEANIVASPPQPAVAVAASVPSEIAAKEPVSALPLVPAPQAGAHAATTPSQSGSSVAVVSPIVTGDPAGGTPPASADRAVQKDLTVQPPSVVKAASPGEGASAQKTAAAIVMPTEADLAAPVTPTSLASPGDAHGGSRQPQAPQSPAAIKVAQHENPAVPFSVTPPLFGAAPAATIGGTVAASPMAPDTAELAPQIVQAIKLQWNGGVSEARIRLQPEYLGELTISIRVERGVVTASLESDTAAVRQWLQGHEGLLRQGLADQGLALDRLVVSGQPSRETWDTGEQQASDQPSSDDQDSPQEKQSPRRPRPDEQTFEVVV